MTAAIDTLNRPPIMKPIERKDTDERKPFETEAHGDLYTVHVPSTSISVTGVRNNTTTQVTMPRPIWEA